MASPILNEFVHFSPRKKRQRPIEYHYSKTCLIQPFQNLVFIHSPSYWEAIFTHLRSILLQMSSTSFCGMTIAVKYVTNISSTEILIQKSSEICFTTRLYYSVLSIWKACKDEQYQLPNHKNSINFLLITEIWHKAMNTQ